MTYADHAKFIWQLLALRKRFDVDPYSLSQEQLRILKDYSLEQAELEERQASAKTAQSPNKANPASAKRV